MSEITIIHISSPETFRGGEQQIFYLMKGLHQLKINQILIAPQKGLLFQKIEKLGLPAFDFKKGVFGSSVLKKVVKDFDNLLIHAHDSKALTQVWLTNVFSKTFPVVISRRVLRSPTKGVFPYGKYNHPQLKSIICVSEAIANLHRKNFGLKQRIITIYDAIDTTFNVCTPGINLKTLLGVKPNTHLIGTIAAISPEKDYHTFLKTCEYVLSYREDVAFVAIGSGDRELQNELEQLTRELELESKVHWLGFREDVLHFMSQLDVFLFTSKWEGLGSSILQAQIRKIPVVSTATGGTPELVKPSITGLLAPIGDYETLGEHCLAYLNDSLLTQSIKNQAYSFAKEFSIDRMAEETFKEYQLAIKN